MCLHLKMCVSLSTCWQKKSMFARHVVHCFLFDFGYIKVHPLSDWPWHCQSASFVMNTHFFLLLYEWANQVMIYISVAGSLIPTRLLPLPQDVRRLKNESTKHGLLSSRVSCHWAKREWMSVEDGQTHSGRVTGGQSCKACTNTGLVMSGVVTAPTLWSAARHVWSGGARTHGGHVVGHLVVQMSLGLREALQHWKTEVAVVEISVSACMVSFGSCEACLDGRGLGDVAGEFFYL